MIRFMLAACIVIVAALLAPVAVADTVINSADLIVASSPLTLLCILWPPLNRRRGPRQPWFVDISETHPEALGSLDHERIGAPPTA
ncbi:hypothetical protein [Microbacterium testaceum]|uniref:Uncharacterized protein n=1 Tax=Microbacterium testaceum TaxID=2033 RepID=A0A147F501_MICTE|nr:hypothetical protein [Microbacterium testaceum]KTS09064.1 hypothetical protein RSA3_14300 [Microbacterium testaceum]